jgi:hypothetical protein
LLAATSITLLSGCFGDLHADSTPAPAFAVEADSILDGFPGTLSVDLLARPTAERPARLNVTLVNTSDRPREIATGYPFAFADHVGVARDGEKLVLEYEPTANDDSTEGDRGDCWQTDSPYVGADDDGDNV